MSIVINSGNNVQNVTMPAVGSDTIPDSPVDGSKSWAWAGLAALAALLLGGKKKSSTGTK